MVEKILCVIAKNGFRDEELLEPLDIFTKNNIETTIASTEQGECTGSLGATVQATIALSEVDAQVFDAIALIGGPGALTLQDNEDLRRILLDAREANRIIGAICISPVLLAEFELIDHMHATVFPDKIALDAFKRHKVMYIPESVVVDEWLVTANGPSAAVMYAENIIELLRERT